MTTEDIIRCLQDYEATTQKLKEERSWLLKQHEQMTEERMQLDLEIKRLKEDNQWLEQNRSEMWTELTRLRAVAAGLTRVPTPEPSAGSAGSTPPTSSRPTTERP